MPAEPERTRLLVVEDDPDLAALREVRLADEYEVRTAHSGKAALESMADHGADVVLLDRRMPGLSGDEVAHRLDANGHDAQVVMITAVSPSPEIADLPIDDYLLKPVDEEQLRAAVETADLVRAYDESVAELLALTARRHVLEAQAPADELEASEAFDRLTARVASLQDSVDDTIEQLRCQSDADVFERIENGLTTRRIESD